MPVRALPATWYPGGVQTPFPASFRSVGLSGAFHQCASLRAFAGKPKTALKLEELQLISRAKAVLIEYLKLTEPQAHRCIEKQAMDLGLTRRQVALNILKTYES